MRAYRFRDRAEAGVAAMEPAERRLLDRYVAGVNAGLAGLSVRPFEYLLLGDAPRAWSAPDSLLVIWAMYLDLQGEQEPREFALRWLRAHATPEQLAVLMPAASSFDAPLDANAIAVDPAPMPASAPAWFGPAPGGIAQPTAQARVPRMAARSVLALWRARHERPLAVGSNSWVVSGARTGGGAALMADDMHLSLRLPNTWYRLSLSYPESGRTRRLVGVTLPGVPMLVVGSNGDLPGVSSLSSACKAPWCVSRAWQPLVPAPNSAHHQPHRPQRVSVGAFFLWGVPFALSARCSSPRRFRRPSSP